MALKINWRKLGLDPENIVLTDLNSNKKIGLESLKTGSIKGNHYILIGIQIKGK